MGYTALLVYAGLQTIPKYIYEAAAIDGSTEWRMFWRITMPLLRPVLAMVLVITVIGSFQIFDTVAVTTRGGPVDATRVMQYYIYQKAFGEFHFGYAARCRSSCSSSWPSWPLSSSPAARRRVRPRVRSRQWQRSNATALADAENRQLAGARRSTPAASPPGAMILFLVLTIFPF